MTAKELRELGKISIHAPREGSDPGGVCHVCAHQDFNPRSP